MSDLTPVAHVALSGGSFYVYEGEDELLAFAESDPLAVVVRFNKTLPSTEGSVGDSRRVSDPASAGGRVGLPDV